MTDLERPAEFWSDFDGTAVELVGKTNPRNWSKYPLSLIPGYGGFLRGVQSGGVEIGGIVSRRPGLRRFVTARSIAKLGLSDFFVEPGQVVLAGSERAKARFILERSEVAKLGVAEDKPHRLGMALLAEKLLDQTIDGGADRSIVLGAVSHTKSQEYLERLLAMAASHSEGVEVRSDGDDFSTTTESFSLGITPLAPYSKEAGEAFAKKILI